MGAVYKNYSAGSVKNTQPGYTIKAYLLPVDWVQQFAEPVGNAAAGNRKTIDESHIALAGKGAIELMCAPDTVEAPGEMIGEKLAKRFGWKPKVVLAGDSAELWDMMDGVINKYFLLFIEDSANCSNGIHQFIQFGCECDPCTVDTGSFTSGTTGTGRKQYEFQMLTYCKFFYNGVITPLDADAEIIE